MGVFWHVSSFRTSFCKLLTHRLVNLGDSIIPMVMDILSASKLFRIIDTAVTDDFGNSQLWTLPFLSFINHNQNKPSVTLPTQNHYQVMPSINLLVIIEGSQLPDNIIERPVTKVGFVILNDTINMNHTHSIIIIDVKLENKRLRNSW